MTRYRLATYAVTTLLVGAIGVIVVASYAAVARGGTATGLLGAFAAGWLTWCVAWGWRR